MTSDKAVSRDWLLGATQTGVSGSQAEERGSNFRHPPPILLALGAADDHCHIAGLASPRMADEPLLPSLSLSFEQVTSERTAMNSHAESLDTKAGVILGFAGILVGLGATAQTVVSSNLLFKAGLAAAVVAAVLARVGLSPAQLPRPRGGSPPPAVPRIAGVREPDSS